MGESSKGNCEEERGVPRVLGYFSVLASKGDHELAVAYPVLYLPMRFRIMVPLFFVILAVSLLNTFFKVMLPRARQGVWHALH